MIFETHAHYDDNAFEEDRDEILSHLKTDGISHVINIGSTLNSIEQIIELMKKYPDVYGAIGIHPEGVANLDEKNFEWLKQQCHLRKVVGVGEIGLDYYWDEPDREIQKHWFCRQIRMAREVSLPMVIHSREASMDTINIMKEEKAEEAGGVIHCYSYSKETAKTFLDMGFYFGIGGVVTFKNAKKLKEVVEYLPMDRILIETDSPYLAPEPYRGKRNSSRNLPFIIEEVGRIKGLNKEQIEQITWENAKKLFRIEA